jgi:hypothetical protein
MAKRLSRFVQAQNSILPPAREACSEARPLASSTFADSLSCAPQRAKCNFSQAPWRGGGRLLAGHGKES